MSIIRVEQLEQPLDITGSLFGTSSYATTASYALNANNTINTSAFATTGSNTFVGDQIITGSIDLTGTINGVKQLTQILRQTSNSAPSATTLVNTTGTTFTWQYYNTGWYRLTANDSVISKDRTFVTFTPGYVNGIINTGNDYITWHEILDSVTIDIFVKRIGSTGEDDILFRAGFDIKIYP